VAVGPPGEQATTQAGIPLETAYVADHARGCEWPGEYPFTRGRPRRGGGPGWTHRELSGEGSPAASNAQFQYLIAHGAHGIDVIGDMATQAYLDADHPMARMSIGTNGVSLSTIDDFRELYRDLPFDRVSVSHSLPSAMTLAGLSIAAEDAGIDVASLRGSVLQVPLFTEDCAYATHLPAELRMRLACDGMRFAAERMPKFHSFVEDTYYISDGGMDAVTEMALGFVELRAVVREMERRGVPIDSYAPRIAILVNCRMDLFEEIAKIRATRRIYARMMREELGALDERSWACAVTVHTSGLTLTASQPINNVVRGAVQALAMVLAGVDAMEISTFDEAFRTPAPLAHLVALRTQQVIALETGAGAVRDPLGGSHFVESLTDELERRILAAVAEIEAEGDPIRLADEGWFRTFFDQAVIDYQHRLRDGRVRVVGVTDFAAPEDDIQLLREISEEKIRPAHDHIETVAAFKASRDLPATLAALDRLESAAADPTADLMGPIIDGFRAGASIGEMSGAMRTAYGLPWDFYKLVDRPR
jgi:methylmalonyl-CoA mutase N-terminal domain/subunit